MNKWNLSECRSSGIIMGLTIFLHCLCDLVNDFQLHLLDIKLNVLEANSDLWPKRIKVIRSVLSLRQLKMKLLEVKKVTENSSNIFRSHRSL